MPDPTAEPVLVRCKKNGTSIQPVRSFAYFAVMLVVLVLLVALGWVPDRPAGIVLFVVCTLIAAVGLWMSPRFTVWIEFGDHLRHRTVLRTEAANWSAVRGISVTGIGQDLQKVTERDGVARATRGLIVSFDGMKFWNLEVTREEERRVRDVVARYWRPESAPPPGPPGITPNPTVVRATTDPADVERLAKTYGEGEVWFSYVHRERGIRQPLGELLARADPRERLWIAEISYANDPDTRHPAGYAAVEAAGDGAARIVLPTTADVGLAKRLLAEAAAFCRAAGYWRVELWADHRGAVPGDLYTSAGFRVTEEKTVRDAHSNWMAERYERVLA